MLVLGGWHIGDSNAGPFSGSLPHDPQKVLAGFSKARACSVFAETWWELGVCLLLFQHIVHIKEIGSFKRNMPLVFLFFFSPPLQDRPLPPALHPDVVCMTKKECFNCLLVMGSVFKITVLIYSAFWSFLMSTSNCKTSIFFQTVPCFLLQFQASVVGGYLFS